MNQFTDTGAMLDHLLFSVTSSHSHVVYSSIHMQYKSCVSAARDAVMQMIIQPMNVDERYMPVAHTCFNLLDLPSYSNREILRRKLLQAIEHTHGFALVWRTTFGRRRAKQLLRIQCDRRFRLFLKAKLRCQHFDVSLFLIENGVFVCSFVRFASKKCI